jgi:membrane-associated phospholipid phosphatase
LRFVAAAARPERSNLLLLGIGAAALAIEFAFVIILRDGDVFAWEQSFTRRLQDVPYHRVVFELTSPLTNTLSVAFLAGLFVLAALAYARHHRTLAAFLLLSFPVHVLAQFPKALIDRPRPSPDFGVEGVGGLQSFPSGHAEYVVTFYGFLAYIALRRIQAGWARLALAVAWLAFALATGFGRIAEGRHWALDVIASYVVGVGLLAAMVWLHRATLRASASPSAIIEGEGERDSRCTLGEAGVSNLE